MGKYSPPPGSTTVLGLEAAGRVDKVSEGCTKWSVGDRVMALVSGKAKYLFNKEEVPMEMKTAITKS